MSQTPIVTADEVEIYCQKLRSFGDHLEEKQAELRERLSRLAEEWQDPDLDMFADEVQQAVERIHGLATNAAELAQSLDTRVQRAREIEQVTLGQG